MVEGRLRARKGDISLTMETILMLALGAAFLGLVAYALLKKFL